MFLTYFSLVPDVSSADGTAVVVKARSAGWTLTAHVCARRQASVPYTPLRKFPFGCSQTLHVRVRTYL